MKKLIAMLGAAAMAFGLFADDPVLYSMSFEAAESAKGVSGTTWTPGTGWDWSGADFTLATDGASRTLPYTESGTAMGRRNVFDGQGDNYNYLPLETGSDELTRNVGEGNLYLDQLVKFTGFEEPQTNLVAGTKIAVWMSEFPDDSEGADDDATITNLFVTCGKVDNNDKVEQIALKITGDFELDKWYRLTIKSLGNIFESAQATPRAGFAVYIDGQQVAAESDVAKSLIANVDAMTTPAKNLMAAGKLFTAIDDTDATFAKVGYKGIGAIDDIILDAEGPEFCNVQYVDVTIASITGAKITVKDAEDNVIEIGATGKYSIPAGDFTITYEADTGYILTTKTIDHTTDDEQPINDSDQIQPAKIVVNVAYNTLADSTNFAALAEALVFINDWQEQNPDDMQMATIQEACEYQQAGALYAFPKDAQITITAASWDVMAAGVVTNTFGAMPEKAMSVAAPEEADVTLVLAGNIYGGSDREEPIDTVVTASDVELAGNLVIGDFFNVQGEGAAALVADKIAFGDYKIKLVNNGKVITTTQILDKDTVFVVETGYEVKETVNEDSTYTYTAVQSEPEIEYVTFTVSYEASKVENVTVKTNDQAVADVEGVYTVESNAVVTVAATAKDGYKNVTITGDNVTVDQDGKFTADQAESIITISADAMVYAEIPKITETFTYNGEEQTAIKDDEGYTVAGGAVQTNAGDYEAEVALATGYDAWEDGSITNKFIAWSIGKAAATVTADDKEMEVGGTLPEFTATVSGLFGSDAIDPALYTLSTTADGTVAGDFDITVQIVDNAENYTLTGEKGKLTVKKAEDPTPSWVPSGEKEAYNEWKAGPGSAESDFTGTDTEKAKKMEDSFLLNCAPTEVALKTAKDNFKITSITKDTSGNWVVLTVGQADKTEYGHGRIKLEAFENVGCTGTPVTPGTQEKLFWKASLVHPTAND